MKNSIILLIASCFVFCGLANAQDTSLSASTRSPWNFKVQSQTGFIQANDVTLAGIHAWQETGAKFGYDLGKNYGLSVFPSFINSFFDTGVAQNGLLTLNDTSLDFAFKDLGSIEPAGVGITGAFRVALPTSRITETEEQHGLITYLQPSVALTKNWESWSWRNELGGRLYFNEVKFYDEYRYKDRYATVKTVSRANKPNTSFRQTYSSTLSYSILPKLNLSLNAYVDVDWRYNPETLTTQIPRTPVAPASTKVAGQSHAGVSAAPASAPTQSPARHVAPVVAVPRASITPELAYEVTDNFVVAAGYSIGKRPGGSISPLGEYWFNDFSLQRDTQAYLSLSYTF